MMEKQPALLFSTILASSIHDMKNSLGMVLNSLETMLEDGETAGQFSREQAAKLQYEAKRVNDNLIQLLTIYRVDNEHYGPQLDEYALSDFLEESYLLNKPLLDFYHIDFQLECDSELFWYFDRDLIAGVVNSVINNALRYTKDRIRLSARDEDGWLRIDIRDNGDGFPQHMLIDDDEAVRRISFSGGHTGLGLHFGHMVASLHTNQGRCGYIRLSNDGDAGGGCFSLFLP